jgi:hypothetical protein
MVGWEQRRLGEAASLLRDRKLIKVKGSGQISARAQHTAFGFDSCVPIQLVLDSGSFRLCGPACRILEKQNHLMSNVWIRKNLTHLQSVLLFKDSSCAQRRAHTVRWQLEGHYLTFTFCRKNVGTSRSCPSIIVGSLFSKRPRDTGSNCNVSCFASGFLVAAACVFGSDLKSARGGAGFCGSFSPRTRFSSCFGASG